MESDHTVLVCYQSNTISTHGLRCTRVGALVQEYVGAINGGRVPTVAAGWVAVRRLLQQRILVISSLLSRQASLWVHQPRLASKVNACPAAPQADALAEFKSQIGSSDTANACAEPMPVATLHKIYTAAKAAALGKLDEGGVFDSGGARSTDQAAQQQRGHAHDAASVRCRFRDTLKLECVIVLAQCTWRQYRCKQPT